MRGRFRIGESPSVVPTLRAHWGANMLAGACFVAMSTFTVAQVPAQTSPPPQQAKANEVKAGKQGESGACDAKADALASRIRESDARDAGEYPEKMSEENREGTSATNLILQDRSTEDSTSKEVRGGEPATDVGQQSHSEESARPNTGSPQQCTLSKGSRETEHAPLR
jgi:hypothetical protein